jgi:hypothetical protein
MKKRIYIRVIKIQTVDLLIKIDQTDCYINDSIYFKDPICILECRARAIGTPRSRMITKTFLSYVNTWLE